jgi:hypothetical protein
LRQHTWNVQQHTKSIHAQTVIQKQLLMSQPEKRHQETQQLLQQVAEHVPMPLNMSVMSVNWEPKTVYFGGTCV